MKKNENLRPQFMPSGGIEDLTVPEGYPVYPENEDIYNKFRKARSIDPEEITLYKEKEINEEIVDDDFNDDFMPGELKTLEYGLEENEEIALPEVEEDVNLSLQGEDAFDPIENLED